jgi:hypothetical protein
VCNLANVAAKANVVFRVAGKKPELWDAVTGEIRDLPEWRETNGRTAVPLAFAPRGSWFVVFRKTAEGGGVKQQKNFPALQPVAEIAGPWQVSFDPKWGGPRRVAFETLEDWTKRPEKGIRYYSGTAVYRSQFHLPASALEGRLFLDLGAVKNVARAKVNNREIGVLWTAPWRADITGAVRQGPNDLEIEVANLWPNRLIGDAELTEEKRFTKTNVRTYDTMASGIYRCPKCRARQKSGQPADLVPSGLLGPVTLQTLRRAIHGVEPAAVKRLGAADAKRSVLSP